MLGVCCLYFQICIFIEVPQTSRNRGITIVFGVPYITSSSSGGQHLFTAMRRYFILCMLFEIQRSRGCVLRIVVHIFNYCIQGCRGCDDLTRFEAWGISFHSPKISGIRECIIRYRHTSNPLLYYYDGQAISNLKNESFGYLKMFLLFNLLHSLKIDCETSKMSKVQTYLNTLLAVLAVKLHNTELHIFTRKECTYISLRVNRNNAHDTIYIYNENYTTLHNFTIAKLCNLCPEPKSNRQKRIFEILFKSNQYALDQLYGKRVKQTTARE